MDYIINLHILHIYIYFYFLNCKFDSGFNIRIIVISKNLMEDDIMQSTHTTNIPDCSTLKVWQKAMDFNLIIYDIVEDFPKSEDYIMKPQILRSCTSISANIAEGNALKQLPKREVFHLNVAIGSASETINWLKLALLRKYITQDKYDTIFPKIEEIIKMLYGYRKSIHNCINEG